MTLEARCSLANFYLAQGLGAEAEVLLKRTIPGQTERSGPYSLETLNSRSTLRVALRIQQRYEEAERELNTVVRDATVTFGEEISHTLLYRENLARVFLEVNDLQRSVQTFSEILDLHREHRGEDHPKTVAVMSTLASILPRVERQEEARELFWEALSLQEERYGTHHAKTTETLNNMAVFFGQHGPKDEAEDLFSQVVEITEELYGAEDWRTLLGIGNLAGFLIREGQLEAGRSMVLQNLEVQRRVLGEGHRFVAGSLSSLYHCAMAESKYAPALEYITEAIDILIDAFSLENPRVAMHRVRRAAAHRALFQFQKAEDDLLEALPVLIDENGEDNRRTQDALEMLAAVQEAQGKREEAQRTRGRLVAP